MGARIARLVGVSAYRSAISRCRSPPKPNQCYRFRKVRAFAQRLEQVIRAVSGDARGVILYALAIALAYATGWTAEQGLSRTIAAGARLHAEISPPHPLIGHESGVRALQHNPAGFEHIAVIAGFERFGDALLDKEQGHAALAV